MSVKYNLNHIYAQPIGNEEIIVTADETVELVELTLFEKSLALTGDLKRLPVIRSISLQINPKPNCYYYLSLTGAIEIKADFLLFNKTFTEAELEAIWNASEQYDSKNDILWSTYFICHCRPAPANGNENIAYIVPNPVWPFRGGILAKNILTLALTATLNGAAAGTSFPADAIMGIAYVEIDWVPISTNEFKEYILESVYAED